MNKEVLSQQEIDALLRSGESAEPESYELVSGILSEFEADALGEIGNICFGSAATALSTLLNQKVDITTPKVEVIKKELLKQDFPLPHVTVQVEYTDGFVGNNVLAIRVNDAGIIADLMLGGDGTRFAEELSELHFSAVAEAMNQMMGSASTSMSTVFNMMVNITPPIVKVHNFVEESDIDLFPDSDYVVMVSFRLIIGTLIDSNIKQLLPVSFAKAMIEKLMGGADISPVETTVVATPVTQSQPEPVATQPEPIYQQPVSNQVPMNQGMPQAPGRQETAFPGYNQPPYMPPPDQANPYAGMYAQAPYGHQPIYQAPPIYQEMPPAQPYYQQPGMQMPGFRQDSMNQVPDRSHQVQPVQFASFEPPSIAGTSSGNLDLLLDIPLSVTVELGRSRKQIREVLELTAGSIIELDKLAGEPVDILVNNKLVAKGEVVVIEENFGVRVTDIISPADRVRKLQ